MMFQKPVRLGVCSVLLIMGLCVATSAAAQSSVGSGPLTGSLTDTEPTTGVLSIGWVKVAPGMTVREIGWDDNVFDEPPQDGPKEDYVASVMPDVSAFTRLRFVQLSAYAGSELTYYKTYDSERSVGHAVRGRADFLLSRVRPFVAAGQTKTRTRPNGEIDARANRVEDELSGGLAFDLSAHALFYGAANRTRHDFESALEDGIDLGGSLTRDGYNYQAGLKTDLTPLLSLQLFGSYQEDRFKFDPTRNGESRAGTAMFRIAPEAVFTGTVTISYKDITFVDPDIQPFRGVVGVAGLAIPILELGRISLQASRATEFSFDVLEAYYVQNTLDVAYTHRLFGKVDAQARASRSLFNYNARESVPPHQDVLDSLAGSLGYNLRNRTRVAVNYEYSHRRSSAFETRNYLRRRAYLSWLFAI